MHTLKLLEHVSWNDASIPGERVGSLLACLATSYPHGATSEHLISTLWEEQPPARASKALQVVVSRARQATSAQTIEKTSAGYRLNLGPEQVDALDLANTAIAARRHYLQGDIAAALQAAERGRAFSVGNAGPPQLADLRTDARADVEACQRLSGIILTSRGEHASALPLLEPHMASHEDDETLLAAYFRSVSAVQGPAAALTRFDEYRADLVERLGSDPGPLLDDVHDELLAADRPTHSGIRFSATNLIGREQDQTHLLELLAHNRLVSIVGPGGIGKTTLAQAAALKATASLIYVVEFAAVTDPEDIPSTIAETLEIRARPTQKGPRINVAAWVDANIPSGPMLLVFDNCEHLIDPIADLTALLLANKPRLRILTTSRMPLDVSGEAVYRIPALNPAMAAQLFRERAQSARPNVTFDEETVLRIVEHLDGLPLAIELAATTTRVLSVHQILDRLSDRFELLKSSSRDRPNRHQTLLNVIDWSWNLLTEAEREALMALSVFPDAFDLSVIEAIIGADALSIALSLADHSLLRVIEADGIVRYRMLETIREYCRRKLDETGSYHRARRQQLQWAVETCQSEWPSLFGPEEVEAAARLRPHIDNLSYALRWALTRDDLSATLTLAAPLLRLSFMLGDVSRSWLIGPTRELILTKEIPENLTDQARYSLAMMLRFSTFWNGKADLDVADFLRNIGPGPTPQIAASVTVHVLAQEAEGSSHLDCLRELADSPIDLVSAISLHWLAALLDNAGDREGALKAATRALLCLNAEQNPYEYNEMSMVLAELHFQMGNLSSAIEYAQAAVPTLAMLGATSSIAEMKSLIALALATSGELDRASALIREINDADEFSQTGRFASVWICAEQARLRGDETEYLRAIDSLLEKIDPEVTAPPQTRFYSPWWLVALSTVVTTRAMSPVGNLDGQGSKYYQDLLVSTTKVLDTKQVDYPIVGTLLFALASWQLRIHRRADEVVLELFSLARETNYSRVIPAMSWEHAVGILTELRGGAPSSIEGTPPQISTLTPRIRAALSALSAAE